jgi:hypothetical protein
MILYYRSMFLVCNIAYPVKYFILGIKVTQHCINLITMLLKILHMVEYFVITNLQL